MKQLIPLLLPSAMILLYLAIVFCVIGWLRWARKSRWPFPIEDKLLRGPGEDLRKRIIQLDEGFFFEFFGAVLVGTLMILLLGSLGTQVFGLSPARALLAQLTGMFVVFGLSGWRICRVWQQRQNCFLGWFGEKYVAEWLEPAKLQGWRIFHDVPFSNNGAKFNIDHVAVGPGGVYVIETKTRRKGKPRPGFKDNVVFFDGRDLVWPWGEDNHGLEQAELNAQWLSDWIRKEIGERVHVSPVLTLPGWWLEKKPCKESRLCAVANPKWLPDLLGRERGALNPKQIELISLRLEAKCRDVAD